MKPLIALLLLLVSLSSTFALTAEELASFLGVSSWQTSVQLPAGEYTATIVEVRNGKAELQGETVLSWKCDEKANPAEKLLVIGRTGDNPGFTISTAEMTMGFPFSEPRHGPYITNNLPARVGLGDYILAGEPAGSAVKDRNSVAEYKRGYLLRIVAGSGGDSGRDLSAR